jgi:hypothetical protein
MRRDDDLGTLTEAMAASLLIERLHVMYAVLDRCEDTGGRTTSP